MAKLSAHGAKEIARWVKPHGETLVLTQRPDGRTTLLRRWTKGASFALCHMPTGEKAVGRSFTDRPTLEQAHEWATRTGWERVSR